jgi:hypothetical protein
MHTCGDPRAASDVMASSLSASPQIDAHRTFAPAKTETRVLITDSLLPVLAGFQPGQMEVGVDLPVDARVVGEPHCESWARVLAGVKGPYERALVPGPEHGQPRCSLLCDEFLCRCRRATQHQGFKGFGLGTWGFAGAVGVRCAV